MGNRDVAEIRAYHDAHEALARERAPRAATTSTGTTSRGRSRSTRTSTPIPLPRDFATSHAAGARRARRPRRARRARPAARPRGARAPPLLQRRRARAERAYPGRRDATSAPPPAPARSTTSTSTSCAATLPDLAAGVYHFGPHDFALRRLRTGDHRAALVDATAGEPRDRRRAGRRSSARARSGATPGSTRRAPTGTASGTAARCSRTCSRSRRRVGVPARVVLGFVDDDGRTACSTSTPSARWRSRSSRSATRRAAAAVRAAARRRSALATLPLSAREVDYPAIRAAHAASSLAIAADGRAPGAAASRSAPAAAPRRRAVMPLPPLAPTPIREPIEDVILRRGSTRRVRAASRSSLAQLVDASSRAATRGVPADFLGGPRRSPTSTSSSTPSTGSTPGAYVLRPRARHALDAARAQATSAATPGTSISARSSRPTRRSTSIWLADLEPRPRAPRRTAATAPPQLEAAIDGGKSYLAAYALGLGATGLTFFDDDVTASSRRTPPGESVMFLMAFGHPRGARTPPSG